MIDLQEMQGIELEIMKTIHAFCTTHGIRYSLAYGTLLGAVRHQGFIPWDDDLDIIMPRPDYEKFLDTFESDHYKVASLRDSAYPYPYAKVYDSRTYLKETLRHTYESLGIFVDVFPVDGLPASEWKQKQHYRKQRFLYKLYMSMEYFFSHEWSVKKNMLIAMGRSIEYFYPLRTILQRLEKNAKRYDYSYTQKVAVLTGEAGFIPIQEVAFDTLIFLPFEQSQFYAIEPFEAYLYALYGQYMTLPPKNERKSEHRYAVGWIS